MTMWTNRSMLRQNGFVAAAAILGGASALLADPPETVRIDGTVRDFQKTNTNFVVVPVGGNGHYAGNIGLALSGNGQPIFLGGGFKVANQWKNSGGNPIPPHLYAEAGATGGVVSLATAPTISGNPTIDSFDPGQGPYGGSNVGPPPAFVTGAPMPAVSEPAGLPPLQNNATYSGTGMTTLTSDVHCNNFKLRNNHVLRISGHRTILAEQSSVFENHGQLAVLPNSSLKLYLKGTCTFNNNIDSNVNSYTPSQFQIINLGTSPIEMQNYVEVYASIVSPFAPLIMGNNCNLCGNFTGLSLTMSNSAGFHNDASSVSTPMMCTVELNDQAGSAGISSSGGIPSGIAFNAWYDDVPATNLSKSHPIILTRNASGVYEYLDDAFFPVDNQLFGNEGQAHNYYFTFEFQVQFVHKACESTFFQFQGCDDAWMFIDGKLAMDLGGVMPGTSQYVEIDRINSLVGGETYTLRFFYAQRQDEQATFNMSTNLDLIGTPHLSSISAGCD